jgi:glycosyltransferase involved in cell wall biosynthesis
VRLDVVIPAHNEEKRIDRTLTRYRSSLEDPATRFLVALDRCTDGTESVVRCHAEVDERVEVLSYPKLGKGGVLMETLRRCDGDLVAFVDADCSTPPSELARLVGAARDFHVAIASRWHPSAVLPGRRPLERRVASRAFAWGIRRLFQLPYRDTQCGAKVMQAEVVRAAVPLMSSRDFLFDVDLLITARALGFKVVEVPTVWVDQPGSRLSAGSDARRMAASSVRLWLHSRVLPVPPAADVRDLVGLVPAEEGAP